MPYQIFHFLSTPLILHHCYSLNRRTKSRWKEKLTDTAVEVRKKESGELVAIGRQNADVAEGNWHAGAIAAAVDNMCSAVVFTVEGSPTATVHYSLSYFSPPIPTFVRARCVIDSNAIANLLPFPVHSTHSASLLRPQSQDEVEMEGRVVSRKGTGTLTAAVVEVSKKESGELVTIGRQ
ncbi:acyl-coenzyme A thioesterase 13-like [Panicum miliaceum]|uniref:Acyl-coenzyme A thioesterase 13-like n=1 Tax=Panicum miliaceum TaxID=4540 RepID=A0A3L6SKT7_PANMI|nr:acyl-coenzyme A thioesterase 13-like [Panicum miliaceum]